MPNTYDIKKALLEKNLNEIEVLSLGSSNAYYGINPSFFQVKGFNLAFRAQSHWYDTQITLKYLDQMPKLKIVLIPIIYLTFGTNQGDLSDSWRMFFYDQTFNIAPSASSITKPFGPSYWLDPRRYSLIALYGERTSDYVLNNFKDNIGEKMESSGWFDSGTKPMDASLNIGKNGGEAHNLMVMPERFSENLKELKKLTDNLKRKNIIPIILQLPYHDEIRKYLNSDNLNKMNQELNKFAQENNVLNYNYMYDKRFNGDDFTDMPDHLNSTGAKKISVIINEELIKPALIKKALQ